MSEEKLRRNAEVTEGQETGTAGTAGTLQEPEAGKKNVSATWAEETIADLDDFIESQGIYIRQ